MGHADLRKTENTHKGDSRMPYAFGLDVALSRPKQDENGEGSDDARTPVLPASSQAPANPAAPAASKPAPASTAPAAPKPAAPAGANGGTK
jgi:type IV pilus assembly protein PilN